MIKTLLVISMIVCIPIFLAADDKCSKLMVPESKEKVEKVEKAKKAAEQTLKSKEAKIGDTVICPVMKEEVKVSKKTLFYVYKGKKIYLCCKECVSKIKENPTRYIK